MYEIIIIDTTETGLKSLNRINSVNFIILFKYKKKRNVYLNDKR